MLFRNEKKFWSWGIVFNSYIPEILAYFSYKSKISEPHKSTDKVLPNMAPTCAEVFYCLIVALCERFASWKTTICRVQSTNVRKVVSFICYLFSCVSTRVKTCSCCSNAHVMKNDNMYIFFVICNIFEIAHIFGQMSCGLHFGGFWLIRAI